jgi:hypothetical protein
MLIIPSWFNYQHESVLVGAAFIVVYLVSYFVLDLKTPKKLSGKAARSVYLREAFDKIEKNSQSISHDQNKVLPYLSFYLFMILTVNSLNFAVPSF